MSNYSDDRDAPPIAEASAFVTLDHYARHYSGYAREQVLERCATLARADLLPIAVSRLNDWVPEVRHAARRAVMAIIASSSVSDLFDTFAAIDSLRMAKRDNHEAWIGSFEQAVSARIGVTELINGTESTDAIVARTCLDLLKKYQLIDPAAWIQLAFARKADIRAASDAVQMSAALPPAERTEQYQHALTSHFGAVRTQAIRALLSDAATPEKASIAIGALMDAQPTMRLAAQYFLKRLDYDVRAYYAGMLAAAGESRQQKVALSALGDIGHVEDIAAIKRCTDSTTPVVRMVAYGAWLKLSPAEKDQIAARMLHDAAPRVRRAGIGAVRRLGAYIPKQELLAVLTATGDLKLLDIITAGNVWAWMTLVARTVLAAPVPAALRSWVQWQCAHYINHCDGRLTPPTVEELSYLLTPAVSQTLALLMRDLPDTHAKFYAELRSLNAIAHRAQVS